MRLIVENGEPLGAIFDLQDGEHLLGRSHKCSVRLLAADVSREHLHISVSGGMVKVESLSKFGARLDGQAIQGVVAINDGQRLAIGKKTVLKLQLNLADDATRGAAGMAFNGPASVAGGPMSETTVPAASNAHSKTMQTRVSGNRTGAVPQEATSRGGGIETEGPVSGGTWVRGSGDAGAGETRAQRTRGVPREVIEEARRELQRREKKRITLLVTIPGALLCVMAGAIWWATPAPETRIAWPEDASGHRLEGYASLNRGREDGGYDVMYPLTAEAQVALSTNGVMTITCSLGRKHDVPMRIVVREDVDEMSVRQDANTVVANWIEQVSQRDTQTVVTNGMEPVSQEGTNTVVTNELAQVSPPESKWSFDKPITTRFCGESFRENGIPFRLLTYEREDPGGRKWMGAAYLVRHGASMVSVCVELPSIERPRAEALLFDFYVEPSVDYVRSWWEGAAVDSTASFSEILAQVRQDLRRQAPSTWANIQQQLFGVLRRSVAAHDESTRQTAMELLLFLRKQQALWFNNQDIQIKIAKLDGDMGRVKQLAIEAQGVFTSPDDWRFYECRRW